MRTTLDLTDEAYRLAKAVARDRDQSLGRTVSELITLGALGGQVPQKSPKIRMKNGIAVVDIGRPITSEEVREFLEESE
jgi:hypothetical protein